MNKILFADRTYSDLEALANVVVNKYMSKHPSYNAECLTKEERRDIFHDSLLALYSSISRYNPALSKPSTWYGTIVLNKLKDHLKSYNPSESLEYENEDGDMIEIPDLASRNTVEDEVIGWDEESQIEDYLSTKDPVDQNIMLLDAQGYKSSEIGARLGLSSSTVSVRLCRLKKGCPVRPVAGGALLGYNTIANVA